MQTFLTPMQTFLTPMQTFTLISKKVWKQKNENTSMTDIPVFLPSSNTHEGYFNHNSNVNKISNRKFFFYKTSSFHSNMFFSSVEKFIPSRWILLFVPRYPS